MHTKTHIYKEQQTEVQNKKQKHNTNKETT